MAGREAERRGRAGAEASARGAGARSARQGVPGEGASSGASAGRPERGRMLAWLATEAVLPCGAALSWVNPAHPGYAYPEAAGLVLGLLAQEAGSSWALRGRIARRLAAEVGPEGEVGRGGVAYLFDAGIVLHGLLLAEARARGEAGLAPASAEAEPARARAGLEDVVAARARLTEGVLAGIAGRRARAPGCAGAADHWSDAWGCHLLKLALPLGRLEALGEGRAEGAIARLVDELLPLWRGDRFVVHAASERTYVHAGCYALEGMAALAGMAGRTGRWGEAGAIVGAGARWLAAIQEADGALPAWHDGARGWGERPSDVVAQALRIWWAAERLSPESGSFAAARARALGCLARRQARSGGIVYAPGGADVNSWCTVFAAQAVGWSEGQGEGGPWLV